MYTDDIGAYAELIVSMVNIDPGRNLQIRGEPVHWDLMQEIAAAAYRHGARYVAARSVHPGLLKARIEHSAEEYLDYVPTQLTAENDIMISEEWAIVSIAGREDPDFLAHVDDERNARIGKATEQAMMPFRRALQADRFPWIVVANPTEGWARKVIGGVQGGHDSAATGADGGSAGAGGAGNAAAAAGSPSAAAGNPSAAAGNPPAAAGSPSAAAGNPSALETLWQAMRPILRLDTPDPAAAWREHTERLKERAAVLDELHVEWLHFEGPGTDLWVGIPDRAIWVGGPGKTPGGLEFLPNLPTEEVFTTPDYRRTAGRVAVTRPVTVMNKVVRGAWFQFSDGKVVDFGAETNADVIARYLGMDAGAAYAGEIALVDAGSPIFQSGRIFYNILFDENAACHIALGGAYPGCIEGGEKLTDEELPSIGANVSFVHTDFMIGSEEIRVTARTYDGREVAVLREGRFVI